MRCPHCGNFNPDSLRYCISCNALLSIPTEPKANLSSEQELVAVKESLQRLRRYVPPVIAESVLHDPERLHGQRREVTVLFADAVNFTRLAAALDAELVFKLINDLLSRLVACIHRYDGVVDKFTGDGLMAIFGAPLAHENDPELAVRAAQEMQHEALLFAPTAHAKLGANLQIRIGIHSGLAIAGVLGTQQQAAYTVIGETVNLAARIESAARPGHILVSSRLHQQTKALFHYQDMGTVQLKGLDEPIPVYEVVADRAEPLSVRGVAGVTSIFLGHDQELAELLTLLQHFIKDQRGRVVTIQGEAGMGKSRLVSEWLSHSSPDELTIWQGRGLPYAQGVSYGIFRSLLQQVIRNRERGSFWDIGISTPLRPFLRQLAGQPMDPDEMAVFQYLEPERVKQLTALAFREWLLYEVSLQPVALILDDFHWADDLSHDLLKSLLPLLENSPILLCLIKRPDPECTFTLEIPQRSTPETGALQLTINITPLNPTHSRALLNHLVNLDTLPETTISTILTRAEGNPFYIEEFVRMLIEKEILQFGDTRWEITSPMALQDLDVPTNLQGLMMTRVDRLPENLQHLLRSAAVIGLQFTAQLLEEIERRQDHNPNVRPYLQQLVDLGILVDRPEAGEGTYAFRHILTQETLYSNLLRSQRPGLHKLVAECLESLTGQDLNNQIEILALHYNRAYVKDKALHYSLLAGERARQRFSNREAIDYYSQVLQLSQHITDHEQQRWQAAIGLGEVQQLIGEYEESISSYRSALDESKGIPDEIQAQAMLRLAQVWDKRGDSQEAEGWLRQGQLRLQRFGDQYPDLNAEIYSELGWLSWRRGDIAAAQENLQNGLNLVKDTTHFRVLSSILNRLGAVHYNRSEWDQAARYVEQALELRERLGDLVGMARSSNNLAIVKKYEGKWDEALKNYQHSLELMERIGEVEGLALASTNLGILYTERGDWEKADENLKRSLTIAQKIGHSYELAQAYMNLGRLYLLQERWGEALRYLQQAIPLYKETGARANLNLNDAYDLCGRLYLEQNQLDQAQEWAQQSYDLLKEVTGAPMGESIEWGRYERLCARMAQARKHLEEARFHFNHSLQIFQTSKSQIETGRTAYWLAQLLLELNETSAAQNLLMQAQEIFSQLGAAADLAHTEKILQQHPW